VHRSTQKDGKGERKERTHKVAEKQVLGKSHDNQKKDNRLGKEGEVT